jgi:4-amino-4-deoxy-L-arabinose transferase-like glycosyltransferase
MPLQARLTSSLGAFAPLRELLRRNLTPRRKGAKAPGKQLGLLALCAFLFFYHLADRDLWSSHEGRAAQNAQTILDDGRWGVLRLFDRQVEMQKPPLYYWLVALIGRVQGGRVDAWAVRLPAALSGVGTVLLIFWLCSSRGRPLAGLVAAVALATMVHFTWLARIGRIDMPLTFAVTLALTGLYLALHTERGVWRWLLVSYLAAAAAVLLKGPVGLVLPAAVVGAFLVLETRTSPANRGAISRLMLSLCWGVPLVLILTVPWFWWVGYRTQGALYRSFLLYHNFERAFGGPGGLRAHPWWFYTPRLAIDLLPWSVLLPFAAWRLLARGRWRSDSEASFGGVWLVTVLFVLSCVRFKRADYLLPAYPGAALLLGCAAERWLGERAGFRAARAMVTALVLTVDACMAGWWLYLERIQPRDEPSREHRRFAEVIRRLAPAPEVVIFFRVEAHPLAFHVGRPLNTVLEWENLNVWVGRPGPHYVVMEPECAREWPAHLTAGRLEEVLRNETLAGSTHEHPLVLLRAVQD